VVAGQSFRPDVLIYLLAFSVSGRVVLMPTAGELGRRAQRG